MRLQGKHKNRGERRRSTTGLLRDELLDRVIFTTQFEARVLIEGWRREYNEIRPHSSLGYRPPAPKATVPLYDSLNTALTVVH